MYTLDKEKVRNILINEEAFDPQQVEILLKNFPPLYDDLKVAVETWLEKRFIVDVTVDNISIHDVMENRQSHFIVAIRDLNRLLNPNLTADKREQWRRILTTPVQYK